MSPQFQRLAWKEYRAARSLWLVLAIFLVSAQVFIAYAESIGLLNPMASFPAATTFVIACCFAVAAVAVAFAGEEEMGTSMWLRQVPMRTRTLLVAKLSTLLAGTAGLILLGLVTAAIVNQFSWRGGFVTQARRAQVIGASLVCFVAISLVASVRSRKVMTAIGISAVAFVAIAAWYLSLPPDYRQLPVWWISCVFSVVTIAIAFLPLAKRWHAQPLGSPGLANMWSGKMAARFEPVHNRHLSRTVYWLAGLLAVLVVAWATQTVLRPGEKLSALGLSLFLFACIVIATLCLTRRNAIWLWALRQAASNPTQLKRTCAVLCWRELRFAFPAGLLAIAFGGAAVLYRVFFAPHTMAALTVLSVIVVEFGLRTFRHDQQKQNVLFWAHRGVSPLLVWIMRNCVWLSVLLIVTLAFVVMDLAQINRMNGIRYEGRIVDFVSGMHMLNDGQTNSITIYLVMGVRFTAWIVGGFFIVQLIACWLRNQLIALFAGVVAFVCYTILCSYCVLMGVPFVILAGPIVVASVIAVILSRRQWMDRRSTLWIGLTRFTVPAIVLLCMLPVHAAWRMKEIPRPPNYAIPLLDGYTAEASRSKSVRQLRQLERATHILAERRFVHTTALTIPPKYETDTIDITRYIAPGSAADVAKRRAQTANNHQPVTTKKLTDANLKKALTSIDQLTQGGHLKQPLPPQWKHPRSSWPVRQIAFAVTQASHGLQDNEPHKALLRLLQGIKLLRHFQKSSTSWDQWGTSIRFQRILFHHIHVIASDDRLDSDQLQAAAREMQLAPTRVNVMLQNRDAVFHQVLHQSGYLWELYSHDLLGSPHHALPRQLRHASYSERMRLLNLITQSNVATYAAAASSPPPGRIADWYRTTPIARAMDVGLDPGLSGEMITRHLLDADACVLVNTERATWLILQLQAYRRRHGEFPQNLDSVIVAEDSNDPDALLALRQSLTDIYSDMPFQYAGKGVSFDFKRQSRNHTTTGNWSHRIYGNQAVLWGGASDPHASKLPTHMQLDRTQLPPPTNEIFWLGN